MAAVRAILSREDLRFPAARFQRTIFGGKHTEYGERERERKRKRERAYSGLKNFIFDPRFAFIFFSSLFCRETCNFIGYVSLSLSLSLSLR